MRLRMCPRLLRADQMQLAEAFRGSAPQPNVGLRHAQSCRGKKHQGDCPDHW